MAKNTKRKIFSKVTVKRRWSFFIFERDSHASCTRCNVTRSNERFFRICNDREADGSSNGVEPFSFSTPSSEKPWKGRNSKTRILLLLLLLWEEFHSLRRLRKRERGRTWTIGKREIAKGIFCLGEEKELLRLRFTKSDLINWICKYYSLDIMYWFLII